MTTNDIFNDILNKKKTLSLSDTTLTGYLINDFSHFNTKFILQLDNSRGWKLSVSNFAKKQQ